MSPAAPTIGSVRGAACTVTVSTASVLPLLSTEKNLKVVSLLIVNGRPAFGLDVVGVDPSVV